ncbi:MAG TPA: hypothetical protein VG756_00820 [Pseudonocardiaceae bacterium]|jgi:hypothetical protein|nr:hypothetical protein [Pseudonocardiaceae bacterium]
MNDDRELLRATIAGAVGAVRRGSEDDALVLLGRLGAASDEATRDSVCELAGANVDMLLGLAGQPRGEDVMVTLDGEDADGKTVSIDEFEPAQRAATRVMLALANGHPEDASAQLDIVAISGDPMELGQVFVHTLCWTLELLDSCAAGGHDVPSWLRPVLASGG